MLVDSRGMPDGAALTCDVCIIGAGPAGLTLARELAGSGRRITILEQGALDATDTVPELDVVSSHFPSPAESLSSGIGGMATSWNSILADGSSAARYVALDPIDLDERHWVPHSGWPLSFDELTPYYVRARRHCRLGPFDASAEPSTRGPRAVLRSPSTRLVTRFDQLGPASVFTTDAAAELRAADDIEVLTGVTALEVIPSGADELTRTRARAARGVELTIHSRAVVVACGAIENARLLLESTANDPAGLGNEHDNVGRFYMDHPRVVLGYGSLGIRPSALGAYEPHVRSGNLVLGKLMLRDDVLRQEGLLNGNAQLFPHLLTIEQWAAVAAARRAVRSLRARRNLREVPRDVARAAGRSLSMARPLYELRVRGKDDAPPPVWVDWTTARAGSFRVVYQPEQAPDRGNRVTLGDRRDSSGRRIPVLRWRWSELDLRSIKRVRQLLADELRDGGLGQLAEPDADPYPEGDMHGPPCTAHHHLGTTRMHRSSRHGVVDADGRVHGTTTVFVAGGSVFPTGGYANPTLTVVALTIRLADHLARALSSSRTRSTA